MKIRWNFFLPGAYLCALAALLCLLCCPGAIRAQRLSANVVPSHYALSFTPDLKAATFTGSETIGMLFLPEPSQSAR